MTFDPVKDAPDWLVFDLTVGATTIEAHANKGANYRGAAGEHVRIVVAPKVAGGDAAFDLLLGVASFLVPGHGRGMAKRPDMAGSAWSMANCKRRFSFDRTIPVPSDYATVTLAHDGKIGGWQVVVA